MVLKTNVDWHAILDLRFLNRFVKNRHFHMESLKSITEALQPGEFLASLDLKQAYLHIPILPAHRCYLRFCVGNRHYQYRALPFGLSSTPQIFTKILVNLVAHLRTQGVSPSQVIAENPSPRGRGPGGCSLLATLSVVFNATSNVGDRPS